MTVTSTAPAQPRARPAAEPHPARPKARRTQTREREHAWQAASPYRHAQRLHTQGQALEPSATDRVYRLDSVGVRRFLHQGRDHRESTTLMQNWRSLRGVRRLHKQERVLAEPSSNDDAPWNGRAVVEVGTVTTIFLCGDVMTGRGIDQILPHPGDPALRESVVTDARTYVTLAERVNGEIPRPVPYTLAVGRRVVGARRAGTRCAADQSGDRRDHLWRFRTGQGGALSDEPGQRRMPDGRPAGRLCAGEQPRARLRPQRARRKSASTERIRNPICGRGTRCARGATSSGVGSGRWRPRGHGGSRPEIQWRSAPLGRHRRSPGRCLRR